MTTIDAGMLLNGLVTARDEEDPIKTPYHVRFRDVLNAERLDQAIAPLITEDRACSANVLLGHAEGELIDLELGPKAANYLYPDDDSHLLTHANHLEDDSEMERQFEKIVPDSLCRALRLRRLLTQSGDNLSITDIQDAFRDHFGHPASICGHPDTSKEELDRTQSNGSFLMDLNERRMLGTNGPPCENKYIEFQVSQ